MRTDINLAVGRQTTKREIKKFFSFSLVFMGIVVGITIILLTINFILARQYTALLVREQQLKFALESQTEKKIRLLLLEDRLISVDKILKTRADINKNFNRVIASLPPSVSVVNAEVQKDKIIIRLQSDNLADLNVLIDTYYDRLDQNETAKRVQLSSFGFNDKSNVYNADLTFGY